MIKIKSKRNTDTENVELTITSNHTGKEKDFTTLISREILANMSRLELKILLKSNHDKIYKAFLNKKIDELLKPLIGVDFSEEDLTPEP